MVVINPGNPTGAILDAQSIAQVIDFAKTHHLAIITDDLTFTGATRFDIDLDNLTPITEYDQVQVGGTGRTVNLGDATLNVDLTFVPVQGDRFVIIDNIDSNSTVLGTFQGLPEGSTLILNGVEVFITYQGGDGNDVEILLADTYITLDNGNLLITDVGGKNGDSQDNLTIQSDVLNQVYIIHDPDNVIAAKAIPGSEWVDLHTVKIPFVQVSGDQIIFELLDLADQLTIDFSLGNFSKKILSSGGGDDLDDTLNINDQDFTGDNTFTLTGTTINRTGTAQITYTDFENLNLNCGFGNDTIIVQMTSGSTTVNGGSGADQITLQNTGAGQTTTVNGDAGQDTVTVQSTGLGSTTTINGGANNDTVNVQTINGNTTVNGGDGDDTINVSSDAPDNLGTLNGIAGPLAVNGNDGTDTLNVSDIGDPNDNLGELTDTQLTGFGMADGLTYGSLAQLNLKLGSGDDQISVHSTHIPGGTNIDAGPGDDTYLIADGWGDLTISEQEGNGSDNLDFGPTTANLLFLLGASHPDTDRVFVTDGFNTLTHLGDFVEHLIGGSGNDYFKFMMQGMKLAGGLGTIVGGPGIDTVDYTDYARYSIGVYNGSGLAKPADVEIVRLPLDPPDAKNLIDQLFNGLVGHNWDELIWLIRNDPHTILVQDGQIVSLHPENMTALETHLGTLVILLGGSGQTISVSDLRPGDIAANYTAIMLGSSYLNLSGILTPFSAQFVLARAVSISLTGNSNGARRIAIIFDIPPQMGGFNFVIMYWDAILGIWVELETLITNGGHCVAFVDFPGIFILVANP